jgi:hypothetical protein
MGPVARALLGDPNPRLSSKTELRFGTNGSVSVDLEKGTYYDHEAGEGGGVLELIKRKTGAEDAFEWMRREGVIAESPKRNGTGHKGNGRDRDDVKIHKREFPPVFDDHLRRFSYRNNGVVVDLKFRRKDGPIKDKYGKSGTGIAATLPATPAS